MALHFTGTSYLGMAQNESFRQLIMEGLKQYGNNYGGSRLSTFAPEVFHLAEAKIARAQGMEAAISLSSGSLAGQLLMRWLERSDRPIYFAPGTHPALWSKGQYAQGRYEDWCAQMLDLAQSQQRPMVLCCNSIDPLFVRSFSFDWLLDWPAAVPLTLVLDDSHGIGVTPTLRSRIPKLEHLECIILASMGKAMGIPAGVILGSQALVRDLWQSPFFGGASPGLPAYWHAFLHADELYARARHQLSLNVSHFREILGWSAHFRMLDAYPVCFTAQHALAPFLAAGGMLISSFPYPSPGDAPITRIVLNSQHSKAEIEQLVNIISEYFKKLK